jgi:DNA-binding SARP family transcriptional activator
MNVRSRLWCRVAWVARLLALFGLIALLSRLRLALPPLPRSLSAPLTVETVEGIAGWLLWLLANGVLVVWLLRGVRTPTRRAGAATARWSRAQSQARVKLQRSAFASPAAPELRIPAAPASQSGSGSEKTDDVRSGRAAHASAEARTATPAAPTPLRVALLGPLEIAGAKRSRRGLRASALELIAYLALQRRAVHRDELLEAFWPSVDPRRTRLRLRQAARDARRLLGPALRSEPDGYALDPNLVETDVEELERLLTATMTAEPQQTHRLREQALALFRGEPLADSDYHWAEGELRRLRATQVELLERVGRDRLALGDARGALQAAERGLALDALNEALWRLALEAESALGLREAVAQRYEQLRSLLQQRVGLEPARETRLLHRQLLGQH